MKVLIVDDSKLLRDRLKNSLQSIENIDIIDEAENGLEAIRIIKDNNPDFVILDIRMPEMSGIEVLKRMKKENLKSTVCIFSNYANIQYKRKCYDLGANYFLDKNQDFDKVIALVTVLSNKYTGDIHNHKTSIHRKKIIDNFGLTKTKISNPQKK